MKLRIKIVAQSKGITQKELAEKIGTSQVMISYYETGKVKISLEKLGEIANALDCEICELIPTRSNFAHFYNGNEYLGVRKI